MPFVHVNDWSQGRYARLVEPPQARVPSALQQYLSTSRGQRAQRGFLILATAGLHLLAIKWLVAAWDTTPMPDGAPQQRPEQLMQFTMSGATPAKQMKLMDIPPAPKAELEVVAMALQVPSSPVDLTTRSDFKVEWSVTRLIVRSDKATPDASKTTSLVEGTKAGVGSSRGGGSGLGLAGTGEGYDPYAGAAPMRRDQKETQIPEIDQVMLAALVRQARLSAAGAGTCQVDAQLDDQGTVIAVTVAPNGCSAAGRESITRTVMGRHLSGGGAARTLRLPPFHL